MRAESQHSPDGYFARLLRGWRAKWWTGKLRGHGEANRVRACRRLGELGDRRAVGPLIELLAHTDSVTAEAAADALSKLGEEQLATAVRGAIEGDPQATEQLRELANRGDTRAVGPLLARLHSSDGLLHGEVSDSLIAGLGQFGDAAVEPLLGCLGDGRASVHETAWKALEGLGEGRLAAAVVGALDGDETALGELGQLAEGGDVRAVPPLIRLTASPDATTRAAACTALGQTGDKRAVDPLMLRVGDGKRSVQVAACAALGRLSDRKAVRALCPALRRINRDVRSAACTALGELGASSATTDLLTRLGDLDDGVQEAASDALVKLGSGVVEPLIWRARNADASTRSRVAACRTLGKLRNERATQELLESLAGSNRDLQRAAAESLRLAGRDDEAEIFMRVIDGDRLVSDELTELAKHCDVLVLHVIAKLAAKLTGRGRHAARAALSEAAPVIIQRLLKEVAESNYGRRKAVHEVLEATAKVMAADLPHLLCKECVTRFHRTQVKVGLMDTDVVVCRTCGGVEHATRGIREIVAVLDRGAKRLWIAKGVARANWLKHRKLFDFDRVEILDAEEYDVERFCIDVGNDADRGRHKRYRSMPFALSPRCELSPATVRMVEETFGDSERVD